MISHEREHNIPWHVSHACSAAVPCKRTVLRTMGLMGLVDALMARPVPQEWLGVRLTPLRRSKHDVPAQYVRM